MRAEVPVLPLSRVVTFRGGGTPSKKNATYWDGSIPWVSPKDMKFDLVDSSQDKITSAAIKESAVKVIPEGSTLVVVRSGILARTVPVAMAACELTVNQDLKALIPGGQIESRYLNYFLRSAEHYLLSRVTRGATVHKLDSKVLKTLSIPLPIREEQKRIVAILDEAFAGIATALANTRKNLANARELFESYLNSVFTETPDNWRERKLGDVCTIKHGFAFKSKYFAPIGDYVVLTPGSFFEYGGFRDQGGKTKFYTGDVPEGFILEKDDFLIAMTEQAVGLLGSSLIVPEADLYLHNQRLGRVRVREGFDWHNDFFLHQFNTTRFRDAVQATASGVKVRHTSPTKLEAISVQVPPNKIDQEIVADRLNNLLAESRRLERIARQKLTALADLKQSLLRKAFSGELTAGKVAPNAILMEEDVA